MGAKVTMGLLDRFSRSDKEKARVEKALTEQELMTQELTDRVALIEEMSSVFGIEGIKLVARLEEARRQDDTE